MLSIACIHRASAQAAIPPSTVTPPSLTPQAEPAPQSALPRLAPPAAPEGARDVAITIGSVTLNGGYPEFAAPSNALTARIIGRRTTVAALYQLAAAIEQLYASAGYLLVRVTIPAQRLRPDGPVTLDVVDGFIERVDVANVPALARNVVLARTRSVIGRRHIKLADLEQAVLVAADIPGLKLKSALTAGEQPGGTVLVLQGELSLVSALLSVNNKLPDSLDTWQWTASVMLNSPFGWGSQIYLFLGSAFSMAEYGFPRSPLRMIGGGVVVPVGSRGLTVGAEYTLSRTYPEPMTGVPTTTGDYQRVALRLAYPLLRERRRALNLSAAVEYIRQDILVPDFSIALSKDAYTVLRIGAAWQEDLWQGAPFHLDLRGSQGLGGRNGDDASRSRIPLSRLGAAAGFTKLNLDASLSQALPGGLRLDGYLRTQATGTPLFLSEQFALDGAQGISPVSDGTFEADTGFTARAECVLPSLLPPGSAVDAAPYFFAAVGWGHLYEATAVQQANIAADAYGAGLRFTLMSETALNGASVDLEFGQTGSDRPQSRNVPRLSLTASVPL